MKTSEKSDQYKKKEFSKLHSVQAPRSQDTLPGRLQSTEAIYVSRVPDFFLIR